MQNVLIIDNDYQDIQNIFNSINKNINSSIKIIGISSNEKDALKYILNEKIDIIILELDIPNVKNLFDKINLMTKIIIISKNTDSVINIINKNIDIYQFFIKPLNINKLIDTLNILSDSSDNIKNTLIDLLENFNFNKNSKGYSYILDCLTFCIKNNYTFIYSIKELYKEMELKYNNDISSLQLEWNISKTIQSMNNYTDEKILNKFFTYNILPSPKTFLNELLMIYYTSLDSNTFKYIKKES